MTTERSHGFTAEATHLNTPHLAKRLLNLGNILQLRQHALYRGSQRMRKTERRLAEAVSRDDRLPRRTEGNRLSDSVLSS